MADIQPTADAPVEAIQSFLRRDLPNDIRAIPEMRDTWAATLCDKLHVETPTQLIGWIMKQRRPGQSEAVFCRDLKRTVQDMVGSQDAAVDNMLWTVLLKIDMFVPDFYTEGKQWRTDDAAMSDDNDDDASSQDNANGNAETTASAGSDMDMSTTSDDDDDDDDASLESSSSSGDDEEEDDNANTNTKRTRRGTAAESNDDSSSDSDSDNDHDSDTHKE